MYYVIEGFLKNHRVNSYSLSRSFIVCTRVFWECGAIISWPLCDIDEFHSGMLVCFNDIQFAGRYNTAEMKDRRCLYNLDFTCT
jgi:hypothetical protein